MHRISNFGNNKLHSKKKMKKKPPTPTKIMCEEVSGKEGESTTTTTERIIRSLDEIHERLGLVEERQAEIQVVVEGTSDRVDRVNQAVLENRAMIESVRRGVKKIHTAWNISPFGVLGATMLVCFVFLVILRSIIV